MSASSSVVGRTKLHECFECPMDAPLDWQIAVQELSDDEIVGILHSGIDLTNVNARNNNDDTLLTVACLNKRVKTVEALVGVEGIDVNLEGSHHTPLTAAVHFGCEEIVSTLLQHKDIDINKKHRGQRSPLFVACFPGHGRATMVKRLASCAGVDVNAGARFQEDEPFTPLEAAQVVSMYRGGRQAGVVEARKRAEYTRVLLRAEGVEIALDRFARFAMVTARWIQMLKFCLHIHGYSMVLRDAQRMGSVG